MNPENDSNEPQGSVSLQDILERFMHLALRMLRYWPIFIAAAAVGVPVFFLAPRKYAPVYESSMVLLYREMIQADALLAAPAESKRARDARLREMVFSRSSLAQIIASTGIYRGTRASQGEVEAAEELRRATQIWVSESNTITITYRGGSPQEVLKVTRALAAAIIEQAGKFSADQTTSTLVFLEGQLASSTKELSQVEQKQAEFLALHPEFALEVSGQAASTGAATRAASRDQAGPRVSDAVAALRRQADRLQRRIVEASRPAVAPSSPPPVARSRNERESSPALLEAERELQRTRETLVERQSRFTDKHPDVVAAREQVTRAQQRVESVRRTLRNVDQAFDAQQPATGSAESAPLPVGSATIQKLETELRQVQAAIAMNRNDVSEGKKGDTVDGTASAGSDQIVMLETEWTSLSRAVASARERTEQIERQLFRASLVAKVQSSGGGKQVIVVDDAFEPTRPIARGRKRVGAVAFSLVMLVGLLIAAVLVLADDRLYVISDVRRLKIGPIAQIVPASSKPSVGG